MRINLEVSESTRFSVLSEDQAESIFHGMLEVLHRTGVAIHHEEARSLLEKAGALVDGIRVRIPPGLVREALSTVPQETLVYRWDGSGVMRLRKNEVYFGPGPTCPNFIDPDTEERRPYLRKDAAQVARVCDALPNIGFVESLGSISDVTPPLADVYEFAEMVTHTSKPIVAWSFSRDTCRDIHRIAIAVAGGEEQFRRRPNYIFYCEPLSPLTSDHEAMDKLLYCAENRIPLVYTPCCIGGGTAPATAAGLLVNAMAESVHGLVVAQLKGKGTPHIMGGVVSIMDMRHSTLSYGAPELSLFSAALTDMAKYLGLPVWSTAGCTDAKVLEPQAALEAALSIHSAMLSGANLVHDVGYTESGMTGSLFQLVMSDEIIGMSRRISRGIDFTSETLAVEAIHRVGPGGNFLADDHTIDHYRREHWRPSLMDRWNYETWVAQGRKTMGDRVREKTREILSTHRGPEVPEGVKSRISEILEAAEEREKRKAGK
ncbi:MAG: trimethylamine methyltransferase family protein [Deltaproteobacteria bacterium]|nr:trimethylamine methyltransferase family protein [Deltaproteobacteria bacterium]